MLTELSGYGVIMSPVKSEQLELLRSWRNSAFIKAQMVSDEAITEQQQQQWFQHIQQRHDQQHFVIHYKNESIGAANLKSIDGLSIADSETLEPGIYIGDDRYRGNILAFAPSLLLLDYCFEDLRKPSLKAKVKTSNEAALNYNRKLGYQEVDIDNEFVLIELTYQQYVASTRILKNLLSRTSK